MKGITHNIRGWTTGFSAPGFKQTLLFGNNEVMEGNQMYNGNQPVNATDHADPVNAEGSTEFKDGNNGNFQDYTFNGTGALTSDRNKNITYIEYDKLNLPRKILVESDAETGFFSTTQEAATPQPMVFVIPMDSTKYTYTPDREKIKVTHVVNKSIPFVSTDPTRPAWPTRTIKIRDTTEYIGPFVVCNGKLDKVLFNGGYVTFGKTDLSEQTYHYFSTDHQGNVRAVYDEKGNIEQAIAYDPFGVIIPDLSTGTDIQPYLYNGKELDRVHGLNWYDYGARMYDVTLGRWTTVDPLCEKYYNVSPYAYCGNNPVNRIDLLGLDTLSVNNLNKDTWSTFNTETDIIKLNELVCYNTSFSINNMFKGMVDFAGNSATTWGGLRYTERPWGDGYFRTSKGKFHSFDDLNVQRNGKYKQGIQGIRYAKSYAYNASKPFIRIGNIIGYYQFTDSFYSFIKNPSFLDGLNLAVDLASFAYWEIGPLYYGIKFHTYSIFRNRNDIKEMNETHGLPPWFGQYNPTLGNYEYSPFIY